METVRINQVIMNNNNNNNNNNVMNNNNKRWKPDTCQKHLGSFTCQVFGGYSWLEETITPGFRPQNKKITDNERGFHPRDCVK